MLFKKSQIVSVINDVYFKSLFAFSGLNLYKVCLSIVKSTYIHLLSPGFYIQDYLA